MYQIGVGFRGKDSALRGNAVTARGLHGVLYHVLERHDAAQATWLHQYDAPKPYTMVPYYDSAQGTLAGIRLNALTEQTAELFVRSWEQAKRGAELRLGRQRFGVGEVTAVSGPTFSELATLPPRNEITMQFQSPTTYRQGPGFMPLPLPVNVFRTAYRAWQAFAPPRLDCPGDWLEWCARDVFITAQQTETVTVTLSRHRGAFTGFVGTATFAAKSKSLLYLSFWHALAQLTAYSGSGAKTTMGMGAVAVTQ